MASAKQQISLSTGRTGLLCIAAVLACAVFGTWGFVRFFAVHGDRLTRQSLESAAATAAVSFDRGEIASLSGTPEDLGVHAFTQAQDSLARIRAAVRGARFAFLIARRGGQIRFLAFAPQAVFRQRIEPGDLGDLAAEILDRVSKSKIPQTAGPIGSRWGDLFLGLTPVFDPNGKDVTAVLGIDISAGVRQATMAQYRRLGFAVSALLTAIVVFFALLICRQRSLALKLAIAKRIVENSTTILYRLAGEPGLPMTFISSNIARLGYDAGELLAQPELYRELVHPDDRARFAEAQRGVLLGTGTTAQGLQFRLRAKGGSYRWFENHETSIRDKTGKLACVEGMIIDITDGRLAAEQLEFANTVLETAMETSPDAILVVDEKARIISSNRGFATMWNLSPELIRSGDDQPVLAAVTAAVKDPAAFVERVNYLYAHPDITSKEEFETKDGRVILRHTAALRPPGNHYLGRIWFFRDVTEHKRAEAAILHAARHDVLTGLANRQVFIEALQAASERARRGDKSFAVLYLDLDHFKDVNDTLGHPAGDALLCSVADRLRGAARAIDTIARFGGDEFAVMSPLIDEPIQAAGLAERLIGAIALPFCIQGNVIHCGVSIGIAFFEADSADPELLLSHADEALYRAKAEGRGGYRFFTGALDTEVRARVSLIAALRRAIEKEEFFIEYQPQIDIATNRIVGVEALARWHHPSRGILLPDEFISAAEKSGLIVEIEHLIMVQACRQAKAWLDAGVAPAVVAVNVSGVRFKSALDLERDISSVLETTQLPHDRLELELTETVLMEASQEHNDVVMRLRESGISLCIDDFGTGYSSFDYLRRFPARRVKIAQEFVQQILSDPSSVAIVRATIGLARELDMITIAEGVETASQLSLLAAWGCNQVQGFYFAKPLTAEDLLPHLLRGRILAPPETLAASA